MVYGGGWGFPGYPGRPGYGGGWRWPWDNWFGGGFGSRPWKRWGWGGFGYGSHLHICQRQAAREYQKRIIDIQRKYNMNNWWYYSTPLDPSQIQQYYAETQSARTEYLQQHYRCQTTGPTFPRMPPGYISPGYPYTGYPI